MLNYYHLANKYGSPPVIRPLPPNATFLIRPDIRSTDNKRLLNCLHHERSTPLIRSFFHHRKGWPYKRGILGLGLWCLKPLSTIFQLYRGSQFYWWRKPEKNHRPVASYWQTLSHNVVSSTPRLNGIQTQNFSGDRHWLHR